MKARIYFLLFVSLISAALYLTWLNDQYWRDVIPQEFGLGATLHSNSDLQGIRESCGVHVFQLDDVTLNKVLSGGLGFVNTAQQARGYGDYYYRYGEWQPTPRQDWKRAENWSYELMCASMPAELQGIILDAGKQSGSYYSHGQEKVLMVLPKHKMIVFIHNG
ncbi:hypothetical protein CHH28_03560 [Bacterioplanes sanyensis]|uniref:Uncharacterized protein n=1 Tax=Bacterioplanes sanyensis TaxID=1249553 RepID=A0A222FGU4_9GAMM|nr:hypothetical protein [Bacterioplanes sanyensis]ASP37806.1 hypothetical protein CHH28_03560 [Bacterioplanes sanyensis]